MCIQPIYGPMRRVGHKFCLHEVRQQLKQLVCMVHDAFFLRNLYENGKLNLKLMIELMRIVVKIKSRNKPERKLSMH